MYKVKIWIITEHRNGKDVEPVEIASERSLRSAKNKATRWIKKNYFSSDIRVLDKDDFQTHYIATWNLYLKSPWH